MAGALCLALLSTVAAGCAVRRGVEGDEPPHAVLRWQARNERDVYGYLVFRSETPDGPFLRINDEIIHVGGDVTDVGSYTYVDRDVTPGRTYYYSLDAIENNGRKVRFSGVIAKTVAGE